MVALTKFEPSPHRRSGVEYDQNTPPVGFRAASCQHRRELPEIVVVALRLDHRAGLNPARMTCRGECHQLHGAGLIEGYYPPFVAPNIPRGVT
eukprot:5548055-Prymnesium_polylepis.2